MIPYGKQSISDSDIQAVVEVLRSDYLTCGPKVEEFEEAFAEMCGARHAISCANGTAALHLALLAAKIGKGDRVVTSPITFLASANCASYVGATAGFVDIDPVSYCLSPDALEEDWKDDTAAVIPVDFAGQPAEMPRIAELARKHGVVIIEDACHAVGGSFSYQGETYRIGGHPWADMTAFSFHPVKTMTTGEGGMITTNDDVLAERCRSLRTHGMIRDREQFVSFGIEEGTHLYEMQEPGYNYRLSDMQAALGLSQMQRLPSFINRRMEIVTTYNKAFEGMQEIQTPELPLWLEDGHHISWHLYVIQLDRERMRISREEFISQLRKAGVGSQVHYIPVHTQPWYREQLGRVEFPCSEAYYRACVSLPLYPEMSDSDVSRVIESVKSVLGDC